MHRAYTYDSYGNIETWTEDGGAASTLASVHARIAYTPSYDALYLKSLPARLEVYAGDSNSDPLLRKREARYDTLGSLVALVQYPESSRSNEYTMDYDDYGNLVRLTDPRSHALSWTFDPDVHAYATEVVSSSGLDGESLASRMTWNIARGLKLTDTDPNGSSITYGYDHQGRLAQVQSPYDSVSVNAVSYRYDSSTFPWKAVTTNKVLYDSRDSQTITTVIQIDGLGRLVQTSKTGAVGDVQEVRTGWNVSGAVAWDAKARSVREGMSVFVDAASLAAGAYPDLVDMVNPTDTTHDALDRVVTTLLPAASDAPRPAITMAYAVSGGHAITTITDPLGNIEERTADERGNVIAVVKKDSAARSLISSRYEYDPLGQIQNAFDQQDHAVNVTYDLLGRRSSITTPDAGTITMKYDNAGNLTEKVTPNLAKVGRAISYGYDGFNRLTGISYDLGMTTPVRHSYGKADDVHHGAGRIIATHDESGDITYEYGLLGELTAKTRSIARLGAGAAPVSATFGYVSDYLGRMHSITYPDGEVVTYTYDAGGQITHVEGNRHGTATAYIETIRYDEFGQRSYIEYNDGKVNTSYTYDPYRRWLTAIATRGEGLSLQNISYSFDTVGNILGTTNSTYPSNMDGSITSQAYSYDSLYRLTNVTGSTARYVGTIERYTGSYSQSFTFDSQGLGNITNKTSTQTTTPNIAIGQNLRYSFGYSYSATKPHQPTSIGDIHYDYDDNGNMLAEYTQARDSGTVTAPTVTTDATGMSSMPLGIGIAVTDPYSVNGYIRRFGWNEENQLVWSNDGNNVVTYRYGADGERTLKYRSSSESLYFDSMWTCQTDGSSLRESKHIFVGQTRIATRLSIRGHADNSYPLVNTYYYHGDHLGSAQTVTDYRGALYERLEYTPYGELWVEQKTDTDPVAKIPYRFTGKEYDTETGLYAFGARYLNPVTGMWISADPAMLDGSFLPVAPTSDEGISLNGNLPGSGGIFNSLNFGNYAYSHSNPVMYLDPDGSFSKSAGEYIKAIGFIALGVASIIVGATITGGSAGGGIALSATGVGAIAGAPIAIAGSAAGIATMAAGAATVGIGIAMLSEAGKGPKGNEGKTETPHGGKAHDTAINNKVKDLKDQGYKDIRKNQTQVDAKGNKVGNNRPDLQGTNKDTGQREYFEFDNSSKSSTGHKGTIEKNDPAGKAHAEILKGGTK